MPEVRLSLRDTDLLRLIIACLFSPTTGRHLYASHADAVSRQQEATAMLTSAMERAAAEAT